MLPRGTVTILCGEGGVGKTWLAFEMAHSVAGGLPFLGQLATQQVPVYYMDYENPITVMKERLEKLGVTLVQFWHAQLTEVPPAKLDKKEWKYYKDLPLGLLIFDTLRSSHDGKENNSQVMQRIMQRLKELRDLGHTVLVLHHTSKKDTGRSRGSGAISDLADVELNLRIEGDRTGTGEKTYRFASAVKTRYAPLELFLELEGDKGFSIAADPREERMLEIRSIIMELSEQGGRSPKQKDVSQTVCARLTISGNKILELLDNGEGTYWLSQYYPKESNARRYEALPLKTEKTEKLRIC